MNTMIRTGVVLALLMSSSFAFADAPTASLKVGGQINVPGCDVTTTGERVGEYELGTLSPTMIKPGYTHTQLNDITLTWTVTCNAKTFLTFEVADNEHDSVSQEADTKFGLGKVNGDGNIGYYTVLLSNAVVDQDTAYLFLGSRGNGSGDGYATRPVTLGRVHGWVVSTSSAAALKAGEVFNVDMTVTPFLGGTTNMNGPVSDQTEVRGSLTLSYSFGL